MRVYPGRLSFLPVEPYSPPSDLVTTYKRKLTRSQSEYRTDWLGRGDQPQPQPPRSHSVVDMVQDRLSESSSDNQDNPVVNGDADTNDDDDEEDDLERVTVRVNPSAPSGGDGNKGCNGHATPPSVGCVNADGDNTRIDSNGHLNNTRRSTTQLIPTPLLPPLDHPVPSDWTTIEDDFVLFAATYQSHLGHDYCAHPESTFSDGYIYLGFVRNTPTGVRKRMLSMLTKTEDGTHVQVPGFEVVKVKAFRLEPLCSTGTMCVDGEKVDHGPIQAQILPGIANVMARPKV